MAQSDTAILRKDARDLLLGDLTPDSFAQLVVPAPRPIRRPALGQALAALYVLVAICSAGTVVSTIVGAVTHGTADETRLGLAVSFLLCFSVLRTIRIFAGDSRHLQSAVISSRVDADYRSSYYAEFVRQLADDVAEGVETRSPEFIRHVVLELQRTLTAVGIPNVQVCILRAERNGSFISYYAGYEAPMIAQGTVISDFAALGARRVVLRIACPLGFDIDDHELAVVATCPRLSDRDKAFIEQVAALITKASKDAATAFAGALDRTA